MDFLKTMTRDLEKAGIEVGASAPPKYWFSTGNYVLNRIISGGFYQGLPQGRITCFTGPAGSGKSFLAANAMREAQKQGAHIVALDSEHALDQEFVGKLGVDVSESKYTYIEIDTVPQTKKVVSAFLKGYKAEYEDSEDAPKILIVIDSLDMLMTETELDNFDKGVSKGDQGQRSKQLKAMLREFVQAIKRLNVSMIVTAHVYKNQDRLNGEGNWIVSDAIKFSLSQIVLLTKLKLRDKVDKRDVLGIRMICEGYKTRFTKPFQTVTIEVPYEKGMDPFNGLIEVGVDMGIIFKKGNRYWIEGEEKNWLAKDVGSRAEDILVKCEAKREKFLQAMVDSSDMELSTGQTSKARRRKKATEDLAAVS